MKYIRRYESVDWNRVLHNATWTHEIIKKGKNGDYIYFMDLERIKLAILNGADINSCNTLRWAVRMGNLDVVKFVLENGANVNNQDNDCKWTSLMSACDDGNVDIAKLLIDYDADPYLGNFQDITVFDILIPSKDININNAGFSYNQASDIIKKKRDEIYEYLIQNSIYMGVKRYNL